MSAFRFSTELRVRLPETDAFGIVFHGFYYTYFDVARMGYLRRIGLTDTLRPAGTTSVIAHASADFKSPARYDDVLEVFARIASIGRTSFTFAFEIRNPAENRLVAVGKTVHVALDEKTWKTRPVPEAFTAAVKAFEGNC